MWNIDEVKWEQIIARLREDLTNALTLGVHNVDGRLCLTGYSYSELFDWDLYFENIVLSYFGIYEFGKSGVAFFLDRQQENGFISRTAGVVWPKSGQHFKPFLAQTALLYVKQSDDADWLKAGYFEKLEMYLAYWLSNEYDANRNGLPVWNSADHSGMDNQDERAGAIDAYVCEGVDLAVFLVREYDAMSQLASKLGYIVEQKAYQAKAEALKTRIQTDFWHEEDGFFYDINVRTGQHIRCKTVAGFTPLWIGAASADQATRLVTEHLTNKERFWLAYPVASMAKDEPGYRQDKYDDETCCNWKGTVWVPSNYYIFHGLLNYGFDGIARELAEKTMELLLKNERTREYFNAETGEGMGLDPFWGWSVLGYVMLMEYEKAYDPSDPATEIIVPYFKDILEPRRQRS